MMERLLHTLPDGVQLELVHLAASLSPRTSGDRGGSGAWPPLLFVHGSFHGCWCWEEHFMPYFAAAGYDCWAVSLRGHGHSTGGAGSTLASHAEDVASVVARLPAPPVLVCHSMAGLIAALYVSQTSSSGTREGGSGGDHAKALARPPLAALALLGTVPPSGNSASVKRAFRRAPWRTAKVGWALAWGSFKTNVAATRLLFFSERLADSTVERHRRALAASGSGVPLVDRRAATAAGPDAGAVPPAPPSPAGWPQLPPARVFVGCGAVDVLVDGEAARETAVWYGLPPEAVMMWGGLAHDVMLDAGWEAAAQSLLEWLRSLPPAQLA